MERMLWNRCLSFVREKRSYLTGCLFGGVVATSVVWFTRPSILDFASVVSTRPDSILKVNVRRGDGKDEPFILGETVHLEFHFRNVSAETVHLIQVTFGHPALKVAASALRDFPVTMAPDAIAVVDVDCYPLAQDSGVIDVPGEAVVTTRRGQLALQCGVSLDCVRLLESTPRVVSLEPDNSTTTSQAVVELWSRVGRDVPRVLGIESNDPAVTCLPAFQHEDTTSTEHGRRRRFARLDVHVEWSRIDRHVDTSIHVRTTSGPLVIPVQLRRR